MKSVLKKIGSRLLVMLQRVEGQDLVEYALVVTLVSLSATAGVKSLATKINISLTGVGTTLTSYTS